MKAVTDLLHPLLIPSQMVARRLHDDQLDGYAVLRQLESTDRRFAPCSLIPGDGVTPATYFCYW